MYAFNSPLILKDPTGRIPVLLVSSGVSALASVASYTVVTVASSGSFSTGGKYTVGKRVLKSDPPRVYQDSYHGNLNLISCAKNQRFPR